MLPEPGRPAVVEAEDLTPEAWVDAEVLGPGYPQVVDVEAFVLDPETGRWVQEAA